jgi:hypothetical protein
MAAAQPRCHGFIETLWPNFKNAPRSSRSTADEERSGGLGSYVNDPEISQHREPEVGQASAPGGQLLARRSPRQRKPRVKADRSTTQRPAWLEPSPQGRQYFKDQITMVRRWLSR